MATGYYLLDNRNRHGDHFYPTRKMPVLAIVVHITAGLEDLDATDDQSAEATARYAATTERAVSWHSGSDSDSFLRLLPPTYTAFQCVGYNSCTIGHEISKKDVVWADEPAEWVARTLTNAATCLRPDAQRFGVPLRRATRAELDAAIAHYNRTGEAKPVGFVSHQDLDPDRRRDPGQDFPWARFFALLNEAEDDMALSDDDKTWIKGMIDARMDAMEARLYNQYHVLEYGFQKGSTPPDPERWGLKEIAKILQATGTGGATPTPEPGNYRVTYERLP